MRRYTARAFIGVLVFAAACGGNAPQTARTSSKPTVNATSGYAPDISPANFVEQIDNPYMTLARGTTFRFRGNVDGELEERTIIVTDQTKTILGVACVVVEDTGTVNGKIAEKTLDWYAQDRNGNVWYFGEASQDYEAGKVVSTYGSWEAGVTGALPGIVMEAHPRPADIYRQEFARGVAEDLAEVLSVAEHLAITYGTYDNVLLNREWTLLEPGAVEQKFYARGVGLIAEKFVAGGKGGIELIAITHA